MEPATWKPVASGNRVHAAVGMPTLPTTATKVYDLPASEGTRAGLETENHPETPPGGFQFPRKFEKHERIW